MARPHIEFIQVQAIPWAYGLYGGARGDVNSKMLSIDRASGASTAIVRYPAGWRRDRAEALAADEEFYVLAGELAINGIAYGGMHYGYLPASYVRCSASSPKGAVRLTFFEAEPRLARPDDRFRANGGLVDHLDTNTPPWKPVTHDPRVPAGLMTKTQRIAPDTGERTWLNTRPPGLNEPGMRGPRETHPVVEEIFVLSGDMHLNWGTMRTGAYVWRPPGVPHGPPGGTRFGYMFAARSKGGPLVNQWSEATFPVIRDPPHQPALSPELEPYGRMPYVGLEPY